MGMNMNMNMNMNATMNTKLAFIFFALACPGDLEAFFFQFLELVVLKVPAKVKLSFVSGFRRLQNHVEFSPEYYSRVLYICIDLIEDPDYNVRFKFRYFLLRYVQNLKIRVSSKNFRS